MLVPVLTLGWKCPLVSWDMLQQCPPTPLPQELSTRKNRVFSPKTKVPNEKGGKQNLQFSLCFSRHPKKRPQNSKVAPWALRALPPTLPSVVQGNIWLCNIWRVHSGCRSFLWRKLFLSQKYWLAGAGRICWGCCRYSCRHVPHQRPSTTKMVFQKQGTLISQG